MVPSSKVRQEPMSWSCDEIEALQRYSTAVRRQKKPDQPGHGYSTTHIVKANKIRRQNERVLKKKGAYG